MYRNLALTGYYTVDDDGGGDDAGFTYDDYIPITNDPGPWIFIGASLYSAFCLCILPVVVLYGNQREKRLLDREEWKKTQNTGSDEEDSSSSVSETIEDIGHIGAVEAELTADKKTRISTVSQKKMNEKDNPHLYNHVHSAIGGYNDSALSGKSSAVSTRSKRHRGGRGPMNYANLYLRANESEDVHEITHGARSTGSYEVRDYFQTNAVDDVRPEDAADAVSQHKIRPVIESIICT